METEKKTCESCKHYRQHYVFFQREYCPTYCGHCVHPRIKDRRPDTAACERFRLSQRKLQEIQFSPGTK